VRRNGDGGDGRIDLGEFEWWVDRGERDVHDHDGSDKYQRRVQAEHDRDDLVDGRWHRHCQQHGDADGGGSADDHQGFCSSDDIGGRHDDADVHDHQPEFGHRIDGRGVRRLAVRWACGGGNAGVNQHVRRNGDGGDGRIDLGEFEWWGGGGERDVHDHDGSDEYQRRVQAEHDGDDFVDGRRHRYGEQHSNPYGRSCSTADDHEGFCSRDDIGRRDDHSDLHNYEPGPQHDPAYWCGVCGLAVGRVGGGSNAGVDQHVRRNGDGGDGRIDLGEFEWWVDRGERDVHDHDGSDKYQRRVQAEHDRDDLVDGRWHRHCQQHGDADGGGSADDHQGFCSSDDIGGRHDDADVHDHQPEFGHRIDGRGVRRLAVRWACGGGNAGVNQHVRRNGDGGDGRIDLGEFEWWGGGGERDVHDHDGSDEYQRRVQAEHDGDDFVDGRRHRYNQQHGDTDGGGDCPADDHQGFCPRDDTDRRHNDADLHDH